MDVLEDFSEWEGPANGTPNDNRTLPTVHFSFLPEFVIPTMVLYGIFSLVGSIANVVVVITVAVNQRLHTLTNVFIAQLSIGDLMILTFCMPFSITTAYYFKYWPYGQFMCYLTSFAGCAGATVTVCMLTVMSYERYVHLMKPLETMATWNRRKVILISGFIYVLTAVRSLLRPLLAITYMPVFNPKTGEERYQCFTKPGTTFTFWYNLSGGIMFYGLNVIAICLLYAQICRQLKSSLSSDMMRNNPEVVMQRMRVVRMLLIMATSFAICWFMINTVHLFYLFPAMKSFSKSNWYVIYLFIARLFEYGNCVINPILYSFLSLSFQKAFMETWSKVFPCLRKYVTLNDKQSLYSSSSGNSGYKSETKVSSVSSECN